MTGGIGKLRDKNNKIEGHELTLWTSTSTL